MGNCTPLVADLFIYCYERDSMDSLNHDNQADVIETFYSTSTGPWLVKKFVQYHGTLCWYSSLTNEKDHHYFLNSADVCW